MKVKVRFTRAIIELVEVTVPVDKKTLPLDGTIGEKAIAQARRGDHSSPEKVISREVEETMWYDAKTEIEA